MSSFVPHLFRRTSHAAGRATDTYSIFDRFGEYELSCNGNVEEWSVIDRLHRISCPTLVINGVEDSAQDECVEPFVSNIPKVRWIRYERSGHMPWFEQKELYFSNLGDFLQSK